MSDSKTQPFLLSNRHQRVIILSLFLAAGFYLTAVLLTGYQQAIEAFYRMGPGGWLLLFTASLCNYSLRYIRWQYYLSLSGWKLTHKLHLRYYLSAFALTTTPGKAGETIRSVLLRPHGIPYHTSLACFFTERLLDLVVITIIALLAILHFSDYKTFVLISITVLIALVPAIRSKSLRAQIIMMWKKRKKSRLGHFLWHVISLLKNARILLSPRPLYIGVTTGLLAWSLQGIAFYFVVHTLGFETTITIALGIYAVSLLAGAASFIPGGIGSTELVMGLLLLASGAGETVAITAPLISRLSTLWFAVLIGMLAAGSLGLHRSQPVRRDKTTE